MKFFMGSMDVTEEPEPDDEFSFEIITDEEVAALTAGFSVSLSSSSSSSSISSQGSTNSSESMSSQGSSSSLGSTGCGTGSNPTVIKREDKNTGRAVLSEEELTSSTRIWYLIQIKGHYQEEDHCGTMEDSSMKRTGWFFSLTHLHEKMKRAAADKKRFNVNAIPEATRQQLKQLYVY